MNEDYLKDITSRIDEKVRNILSYQQDFKNEFNVWKDDISNRLSKIERFDESRVSKLESIAEESKKEITQTQVRLTVIEHEISQMSNNRQIWLNTILTTITLIVATVVGGL